MEGVICDQERTADSPALCSVRRVEYATALDELVLPDGAWDLLFFRSPEGAVTVIQTGQITSPLSAGHVAGEEMMVMTFRPEFYMPRMPGDKMLHKGVVRPAETERSFWIDSEKFEIPTFESAEQLATAMLRKGVLQKDAVVADVLSKQPTQFKDRTVQRHIASVTGLTLKTFQQISRVRTAADLLLSGKSPSQVSAELSFTDQSHLTHSLKRFFGVTPGQLVQHKAFKI